MADLRAPTPSAAAELAVYDFAALLERIAAFGSALNHAMLAQLKKQKNKLEGQRLRLKYLSPVSQIQQKRMYCMDLEGRLTSQMKTALTQQWHRMGLYAEKLKGLSPLEKLHQGYAYIEDIHHRVVNDVRKVKPEDRVEIYVKNGIIQAKVEEAREETYGEGADIRADI